MPVKRFITLWKRGLGLTLCVVMLALLAVGPFHLPYGNYSGRNGVIEALDDVAAHHPIKFYAYHKAQIDYQSITPGIECPGSSGVELQRFTREFIPEAFVSESYTPSWIAMRRSEAARSFAYLYNATILRAHHNELSRACPGIRVTPYSPNIY